MNTELQLGTFNHVDTTEFETTLEALFGKKPMPVQGEARAGDNDLFQLILDPGNAVWLYIGLVTDRALDAGITGLKLLWAHRKPPGVDNTVSVNRLLALMKGKIDEGFEVSVGAPLPPDGRCRRWFAIHLKTAEAAEVAIACLAVSNMGGVVRQFLADHYTPEWTVNADRMTASGCALNIWLRERDGTTVIKRLEVELPPDGAVIQRVSVQRLRRF